MQKNVHVCTSKVDSKGVLYGDRLKRARELIGQSPQGVAALAGITLSTYYDMEEHEGMLNRQTSLAELSKLSSILRIPARSLFDDADESCELISHEQLCAKIKAHLAATRMSVSEFEDRVGFVIEPSLLDTSEVLNWNVDCLRFVCAEIGVEWLSALP